MADHLIDARGLAGYLADLRKHTLGTLKRRTIRQLHGDQEIALILDRNEAGRHPRQAVAGDGDQDQRADDGNIAVRDQAADQPAIGSLDAVIDRVEAAIEEVALLRRHRPAQPQRALRRLQRGRVDGAEQRGCGNHQRELRIHLPGQSRQKRRGQEHRDQHQRDADDRREQRVHRG